MIEYLLESLPFLNPNYLILTTSIMVPLMVCSFLLEARAYHEDDSSENDIKAIKSRISMLEKGVVQYVELPIMTVYSTNLLFNELERYINEGDVEAVFFDLSIVQVPSVVIRKLIIQRFLRINKTHKIFAFATGKGSLVNIAIKFICNVTVSQLSESMFVSTKEEALANIYAQLGRK